MNKKLHLVDFEVETDDNKGKGIATDNGDDGVMMGVMMGTIGMMRLMI